MAKTIKCIFQRFSTGEWCRFYSEDWVSPNFCWKDLRKVAPALCKGLRKGKSRDCIITQTAKGIKIERL